MPMHDHIAPISFRQLWLFALLLALFSGCTGTQKINALKPEPGPAKKTVYQSKESFIALPVVLGIKEMENQANIGVQGLIYEDNSLEGDNLELKIWKTAPFRIQSVRGRLQTVLPLRVEGKYRLGTKVLGISLSDTRSFSLAGTVVLNSAIRLSNWQLHTETEIERIDWQDEPSLEIAGKKVSMTYLVNPAISLFKKKIAANIDQEIGRSANFKPQVLQALEKLAEPIRLPALPIETWLRIVPQELFATETQLGRDEIQLKMGLRCNLETYIGQKPAGVFSAANVPLRTAGALSDRVTLSLAAVATYADISALLTKNFQGQTFSSGKRSITVKAAEVWQKEGKLIVALDVGGSIEGRIYMSGMPAYDSSTEEVYLGDLDFVLDTRNKLQRAAAWLTEGIIVDRIGRYCRYSLKPSIEQAKAAIAPYLNNYSPAKGIVLSGKLETLTFDQVQLTSDAIVALISAAGAVQVRVGGIQP